MAKLTVKIGSTSRIEHIFLLDSASTTGAGKTGVTTTGTTAYYIRNGESAPSVITLDGTGTVGTYVSGDFLQVDSANMPGVYELHVPNGVFASATGVNHAVVMIKGTGFAPIVLEYDLVAYDPTDAVRLGLTALPNANAAASGGLLTSGTGANQITTSSGAVTVGSNTDKTGYSLTTAPPTAATIADAVWDEALSGHLVSGSTGAALNAAGSSGDPWSTVLPGSYGVGTAGKIVGDNLNAQVSTRSTLSSADVTAAVWNVPTSNYDAGTYNGTFGKNILRDSQDSKVGDVTTHTSGGVSRIDADVHAIQNDTAAATNLKNAFTGVTPAVTITANLSGSVGSVVDTASIADKVLGRSIAGGSDGGRMVKDALRFLRNKFVVSGTALTVYQEDDTAVAWEATLSTDPSGGSS
jgi:hypothetical protein